MSFIEHDIIEPLKVDRDIDYVLHFASPASPIDYQKFPVETLKVGSFGTFNVLDLAVEKKAKFLLASTSEVYGDPLQNPQKEEYWGNVNPVGPRAVYDEAKRFAEAVTMAYHRRYRVDTKITRIFNTYGPRMRINDGRAVPAFIAQALNNEPLTVFGDGRQTRSFCYMSDLVKGIYKLCEKLPAEEKRDNKKSPSGLLFLSYRVLAPIIPPLKSCLRSQKASAGKPPPMGGDVRQLADRGGHLNWKHNY